MLYFQGIKAFDGMDGISRVKESVDKIRNRNRNHNPNPNPLFGTGISDLLEGEPITITRRTRLPSTAYLNKMNA